MNRLSNILVKHIREELECVKNSTSDTKAERLISGISANRLLILVEVGEEALCGKAGGYDALGGQTPNQTLVQRAQHIINNEHRLNKVVLIHRHVRRHKLRAKEVFTGSIGTILKRRLKRKFL